MKVETQLNYRNLFCLLTLRIICVVQRFGSQSEVMNIKLTIGFKAASRLSDAQKVKLIRCQGEKLQAPESELQSIIRFCGEKNCIPSGLALVFEYADNADRILDLIAVIRHQQKLLAPANYPHFRERLCIVIRVYLLLSRLIVVISRWRSLQWTACPLLLMRSNKSKVSLASELRALHQMLKKFSIQANYSATGWQASFTARGFDLLNSAFEEFFRIEEHVDKSFTGNSSLFMFRFSGSMHNKSSPTLLQYSSCIDKIGRWQRSIASQAGWTDNQYFGDTEELLMLKSLTDLDADFMDFCKTFPRINGDCASIFPTVVVRELEEVPSFEEDSSEDLSQGKLEEETYSRPALLSTGSSPYSQKSTTSEPSLVASPCSSSRQSLISSPSVLRVLQPQAEFTTMGMSSDLNSEASYFSHYEERARPRTASYPPSTKLRPLVGSLRSPIRSLSKHQRNTVVYHQPSILYQTLKRIDEFETLSEQERAIKKIRVWFRFYFPRRKLSKRLFSRKVAAFVIDHIMDCLWARVTTSKRYQRKLIRQGAALNIQRMFRGWRVRHRVAAVAHAGHLHQQRVQTLLGKWAGYVLAGSVIRRFLLRLLAPMKERLRGNTAARLTVVNAIRVCFMKEVVCLPPSLKKGPSNSSIAKVSSQRFASVVAASSPRRDRQESAAIAIQKVVREFLAMQRVRLRKMRVNAATKIAMFIVHATAKRRHRRNMVTVRAAVRIQQLWRGMCVRREMFREVRAGVILNEIWRKHQAYKSLKAQLRRVDRPYTIVLRGVRNIGPKYVNNEQMKVRVSVWWNPLLHIVGRNDYDAVLQAKQPQLIYVSSYAKIVAENDDGNSAPSPAPSPSPASQAQQAPLRPLSSPLLATGPRSQPSANTAPLSPSSGVSSLTSSTYPAPATRGPDAAAHRHTLSPTRALRQTLNFALQIGTSVVTRRPSKIDRSGRLMCCFDDVAVKIPGCHGNSVVKFEIFDGE